MFRKSEENSSPESVVDLWPTFVCFTVSVYALCAFANVAPFLPCPAVVSLAWVMSCHKEFGAQRVATTCAAFSLCRGSDQWPCRALQPSFLWLYFWILMDTWILTHTYTRNGYLAFFPKTMLRQNVLQISVPSDFPLPGKKFPT